MKILIVVQRYNLTLKPDYKYSFPLGLAYIYSVLKHAGYDVECLNMNHMKGTPTEILNSKLQETKYDVVGIGGNALDYANIELILNTIKSHETKPITVLGGPIITSEPQLIYEALRPNFGVIGEGEETILELVKAIDEKRDVTDIKGIIYSKQKETILNPGRGNIANLDSIPFPDFEAFDFETKLQNYYNDDHIAATLNDSEPRFYPILASRGCPFQCTFCYHEGKYRLRSVNDVIKEIRYAVIKYRISSLQIYDDCFAVNQKRLLEFCSEIKKLKSEISWDLSWSCQLMVSTVDENILAAMKDSGCYLITYGFESYSPIVLKSMRKGITPKQIDDAIKITFSQKMAIVGNFIFGDVAETVESANETLEYWGKNCQGQVNLVLIQPYPGSQIYKHCLAKGLIKDRVRFIKHGLGNFTGNMTDKMSEKEFSNLKKRMTHLSAKHLACVIPISKKRNNNRFSSVTVKCPFCKKHTTYNYCKPMKRFRYENGFDAVCRHCYKHYYIASFAQYIVLKKMRFLVFYYLQIRRFLKVKLYTAPH
jgi:anaerobic magnesium-protoporphyrin IX monomethyl ester cyclase